MSSELSRTDSKEDHWFFWTLFHPPTLGDPNAAKLLMRLTVASLLRGAFHTEGGVARMFNQGIDLEKRVKAEIGRRLGRRGRVRTSSRKGAVVSGGCSRRATVATSGVRDGCFLSVIDCKPNQKPVCQYSFQDRRSLGVERKRTMLERPLPSRVMPSARST